MGKLPAYLFYPNDWRSDPNLCRVSKTARDTWMDMNCLMFFSEERGVLISGGKPWTDEEIAGAIRGDYMTNLRDIAELLDKGVAYRDSRGAIFCKRMVRDEADRQKTKKRVKEHRDHKKRDCNGDVTPEKQVGTVTEDVTEKVNVSLEAFDGQTLFDHLCSTYKNAENSYITATKFYEAIEHVVSKQNVSRTDAAGFITRKAEMFCSIVPAKFQPGLTKWLENKVFMQEESYWREKYSAGGKSQDLDKLYGN